MECWFCEKHTMDKAPDLGNGWYRCCQCGATYVKMLELGVFPIVLRRDYALSGKTSSPSMRGKGKKAKK